MKLLLTSTGLHSEQIVAEMERLVGKSRREISVAVINEASKVEVGDKSWFIAELSGIRQFVGGEISMIDLQALAIEEVEVQLRDVNVLYVAGGHTDYLMHIFESTGFDRLLNNSLLRNMVYVGSSAGSMVVCQRVSTEAYNKIYGEGNNDYGVEKYMGLVPFALKPHLKSAHFPNNREEVLREVSKTYDGTIYAIEDTQAIVVEDDKTSFVGGNIFVI